MTSIVRKSLLVESHGDVPRAQVETSPQSIAFDARTVEIVPDLAVLLPRLVEALTHGPREYVPKLDEFRFPSSLSRRRRDVECFYRDDSPLVARTGSMEFGSE